MIIDCADEYAESMKSQWIPVSERLPDKRGFYLVTEKEYRVGDILRLTEGTLSPVACLEKDADECPRKNVCRTLPMWTKLDELVEGYLDSVSLADLMK